MTQGECSPSTVREKEHIVPFSNRCPASQGGCHGFNTGVPVQPPSGADLNQRITNNPTPPGCGHPWKGKDMPIPSGPDGGSSSPAGGGAWEGMNPEVVEQQARVLHGLSEEITTLMHKIDSQVTQLATSWHGDDSKKFATEWNGTHKPVFTTSAHLLQNMSTTSQHNAQQQRNTSSH